MKLRILKKRRRSIMKKESESHYSEMRCWELLPLIFKQQTIILEMNRPSLMVWVQSETKWNTTFVIQICFMTNIWGVSSKSVRTAASIWNSSFGSQRLSYCYQIPCYTSTHLQILLIKRMKITQTNLRNHIIFLKKIYLLIFSEILS